MLFGVNRSRKNETPLCCDAVGAQQETGGFFLALLSSIFLKLGILFSFSMLSDCRWMLAAVTEMLAALLPLPD